VSSKSVSQIAVVPRGLKTSKKMVQKKVNPLVARRHIAPSIGAHSRRFPLEVGDHSKIGKEIVKDRKRANPKGTSAGNPMVLVLRRRRDAAPGKGGRLGSES